MKNNRKLAILITLILVIGTVLIGYLNTLPNDSSDTEQFFDNGGENTDEMPEGPGGQGWNDWEAWGAPFGLFSLFGNGISAISQGLITVFRILLLIIVVLMFFAIRAIVRAFKRYW